MLRPIQNPRNTLYKLDVGYSKCFDLRFGGLIMDTFTKECLNGLWPYQTIAFVRLVDGCECYNILSHNIVTDRVHKNNAELNRALNDGVFKIEARNFEVEQINMKKLVVCAYDLDGKPQYKMYFLGPNIHCLTICVDVRFHGRVMNVMEALMEDTTCL